MHLPPVWVAFFLAWHLLFKDWFEKTTILHGCHGKNSRRGRCFCRWGVHFFRVDAGPGGYS
ncbi:MAG: hypothetical protein CMO64_08100 [Verrucomicrobiales bacterium]|nr:hypothetical protein [Verrucomicrobiales bacterium]